MKKTALLFSVSGLFFVLDQILKHLSNTVLTKQCLFGKFLGWSPFKNYGVAFGLPLPGYITIGFSILVLSILIYILLKQQLDYLGKFGMCLIVAGALSNLIDRIFLGYTIDYLLILTGVINLGDVMILTGFVIYLINTKNTPT